jgi:hypothetical protein
MIVSVAVPVPADVDNLIPITGYAMFDDAEIVCAVNDGWLVQLAVDGLKPAANTLSKVYCTVYVTVPDTTTLSATLKGET